MKKLNWRVQKGDGSCLGPNFTCIVRVGNWPSATFRRGDLLVTEETSAQAFVERSVGCGDSVIPGSTNPYCGFQTKLLPSFFGLGAQGYISVSIHLVVLSGPEGLITYLSFLSNSLAIQGE